MTPRVEEIIQRAEELARHSLEELRTFVADDVSQRLLRDAWRHWYERDKAVPGPDLVGSMLIVAMARPSTGSEPDTPSSPWVTGLPPQKPGSDNLDGDLLRRAVAARERAGRLPAECEAARQGLADLQHELLAARLEYGRSVWTLYRAGGSLGAIASALGADEGELRRIVVGRRTPGELHCSCSFCNGSGTERRKMVAGPGIYICSDCTYAAREVAMGAAMPTITAMQLLEPAASGTCRFCRKTRDQVEFIVEVGEATICDECIDLCDEILVEDFGFC